MNWTHAREPTGSVVPKRRRLRLKTCQRVYQIAVSLLEGVLSQRPRHRCVVFIVHFPAVSLSLACFDIIAESVA